ncbi:MAG TPA: NAD(P)/FAD-dependent oxidoreductase, partial [Gemmatimonadales bacterium]|nr:NAD(P)/FAD-dependent oxidoreductase [Gemmatimonadales bacterium]
ISAASAAAAEERGAEIRAGSPVARILVEGGRAVGVALEDGTEIRAARVASGADANVTFLHLLDPKELPEEFVASVRAIDYASASCKINLALSELPDFTCLPGRTAGPQHRGTIHLCPTLDYIERAYDDAKYGRPAADPSIEATIPSALDDTLAPPGCYVMSMFTQYFPYEVKQGSHDYWRERYADRCIEIMNDYAPNFKRSVIARQVLTPKDLEARFGLTGGNIMQGVMSLSSLSFMRPVPGYADYRTPIRNLYLCGAATHPGGGVMGACGYNAAREILRDARRPFVTGSAA